MIDSLIKQQKLPNSNFRICANQELWARAVNGLNSCQVAECPELQQQLAGSGWRGPPRLLLSIARPPNLSPVLDPVLPTAETRFTHFPVPHSSSPNLLLDNLLLLLVRRSEVGEAKCARVKEDEIDKMVGGAPEESAGSGNQK